MILCRRGYLSNFDAFYINYAKFLSSASLSSRNPMIALDLRSGMR